MAVPPDEIEHVCSIYMNADPARVWQAINDGSETEQYYCGTRVTPDWPVDSRVSYDYPDGTVAADGDVLGLLPTSRPEMKWPSRASRGGHVPSW